jgi:hypothetical protein
MSSVKKHIKNVKRKGLSNIDVCRLIEKSRKTIDQAHDEANEEAFLFMLAIPLSILFNDYWQKSAKKRAPKFIEEVIKYYLAVQDGYVTTQELADTLYDLAGIRITAEWMERVKHGKLQ